MSSARSGATLAIKSLSVVLTARCNLHCSYCYQNAKRSSRAPWAIVQTALDFGLRHSDRHLEFIFTGGEPLLEFPMLRRAIRHVIATRPPGKILKLSLITNGLLMTDEVVDFLDEHGVETQLSFDGVATVQRERGESTFAALDGLLDHLRAHHARFFRRHLKIAMTLLPATVPHLAESVAYFMAKGVRRLNVAAAMAAPTGCLGDLRSALQEQFARVHALCLEHLDRTGEIPLLLLRKREPSGKQASQGQPSRQPAAPPAGRTMCGLLRGEMPAVDIDGRVYACHALVESVQSFPSDLLRQAAAAVSLGSIRAADLADRLLALRDREDGLDLFRAKQRKQSRLTRCGDCHHVASCLVCPLSSGHIPGNRDPDRVPDFDCLFEQVALACRESFPCGRTSVQMLRDRETLHEQTRPWLALAAALREEAGGRDTGGV